MSALTDFEWAGEGDLDFVIPVNQAEFIKAAAAQAGELRRAIEAECTGLDEGKAAIEERRRRVLAGDFHFFRKTYFPHWTTIDADSQLHLYLDEIVPKVMDAVRGRTDAIAAPRGEAKSTITGVFGSLFALVRKSRRVIVIIADAWSQSALQLESIKTELAENPRLKLDFPEVCGAGPVWRYGEMVANGGGAIVAKGAGQALRGIRYGPYRPDLVILDDLENDELVRKPENRNNLESWLNSAVLNLGDATGRLCVLYIGTILHYDSVLARTMKNRLWNAKLFRAVITWPDRMDLWQQWEEVLHNEGPDEADAFWNENREEMEAGSEVNWAARPIHALMLIRFRIKTSAFDKEYQNNPLDQDNATFSGIQFWVQPRRFWVFYGACDPSLGKKGNISRGGDPSAVLVGGMDRETGILDVVHADIRRRLPDTIIQNVIDLQREWRCLAWAFETVQFQYFLFTELLKRSGAAGVPVPAVPIDSNLDKELRIQSLQPHVANGFIRLHPNQTVLHDQLSHWPMADHDDGPDGLEMLWKIAQQAVTPMTHTVVVERPDADLFEGY